MIHRSCNINFVVDLLLEAYFNLLAVTMKRKGKNVGYVVVIVSLADIAINDNYLVLYVKRIDMNIYGTLKGF